MNRRWTVAVRTVAAAAFSFVWSVAFASSTDAVGLNIKISLKPGADHSAVLALVKEHGRVVRDDAHVVVMRLNDPEYSLRMVLRLKGRPEVTGAEPMAPSLPAGIVQRAGVDELAKVIATYKEAWEGYEKAGGKKIGGEGEGEENETPGLEYLEAYLQFKRQRAYPEQQIDLTGFEQAMLRRTGKRQRFGQFSLRQQIEGGGSGSPGLKYFDYIGPRNLAIPYRTYYGITPCNGRVGAMAFDPTDNQTIYAGGPNGGLAKSTDGGVNWLPLGDTWPTMGVSSIAVKPDEHNILLVGTGDWQGGNVAGFGIMRSADGGATWDNVGASVLGTRPVSSILFDPQDSSVVLAAGSGGGSIARSINGGQSWAPVTGGGGGITTLSWNADNTVVWAGTESGTLKKSTDRGLTWSDVGVSGTSGELHVAASKTAPNTLYVLASSSEKVLRSTDAGASWTDLTSSYINGYNWSQAWYDRYIATTVVQRTGQPAADGVVIGLIDITFSKDGGTTWRNAGGSNWSATYDGTAITHNDQHCFAVNPANPNEWLVGNDGGAYRAVYDPDADTLTYTVLNRRLGFTQFYSLAAHPTNNNYAMGGTQDNATPHSFGNPLSWGNPGAGDGMGCAINPFNPANQYHSVYYQSIYRTNNSFNSQQDISPALTGQAKPFVGELWIDQNNGRYLYCNADYLNRYDAQTNTWTEKVGNLQFAGNTTIVSTFAVATGDSNTMYVGTGNGRVWRSTDFGANWTRIDGQGSGLPNRYVTKVLVNPANKNDVLVTVSGSGTDHVWRCTDTSAGTPAWVSVSGSGATGLPNVSVNDIAIDNLDANTWYVATDIGLWRTRDAGATWDDYGSTAGIPNTQVNKLVAVPGSKALFAATYGRGMWRLKDDGIQITDLTASAAVITGGESGTGTVTLDSFGLPTGTPVQLSSSDPATLQVPVNTRVPYESLAGTFPITTSSISVGKTVTITATAGNSKATFDVSVVPPGPIHADSVTLDNGDVFTGDLTSTFATDYQYLYWQPHTLAMPTGGVFGAAIPTFTPTKLTAVANVRVQGRGTLVGLFQLWDYTKSSWKTVQSTVMNRARQSVTATVTNNAAHYVDPATGRVKFRFQVYSTALRLRYLAGVDSLEFRVN
ncbi:MAG: exo-alpha-sialidase [Fimbriimonadaceae bacterium]|nr:exo-alpha-sialidase [Fimbriimonadaceae bacterium]